ncbi:MAG: hypothetical protein IKB62_04145 [Oscillospiraceae bacterium]|nr:hypothetical protein [Oscillospiraceae bacterium]
MAREKESYRDNLEMIEKAYPDVALLNLAQVAKLCGITDSRAKELFTFKVVRNKNKDRYYISKAVLARELS